jgi:DNA-binding NarL/FixJ family response regulator
MVHLSPRERQVVIALCTTPDSQKEIAFKLGCTPRTLNQHVFTIYKKLEITNVRALMLWYYRGVQDLRDAA